jgi:GTP-binding protein HflX
VEALLGELELMGRPMVVALNKIDRLEPGAARALLARFDGVAISARTGEGMEALRARIDLALSPRVGRLTLRIPYADGPALAACYERGRVLSRQDEPEGIRVEVELPRRLIASLEGYRLKT